MKRTLVVGNWKMHLNSHEASTLLHRLHEHIPTHRDIEVVLAPSTLSLQPLSVELDRRKFRLSAQNAYHKDDGGYTGEVSFAMLRDLVHYAIVGHSARRIYFNETLEVVRDKVAAAVRNGIAPIICIGETKEERNAGETKQVLHDQLTTALANVAADDIENIVVAYEPVWAISTFGGEPAKPADMEKAIAYIRFQIEELYGERAARAVRVLYGGSVTDHDAHVFLGLKGCDGVLVGAASLNYKQFAGIVASAYRLSQEKHVAAI
ncbi:MAG TPA: triose-phosphate isomerase [Candidatus Saccharimonadales bacterium]|nr:triose-phosphate isomerase [Candidatus Saccharimonadales bacterium]